VLCYISLKEEFPFFDRTKVTFLKDYEEKVICDMVNFKSEDIKKIRFNRGIESLTVEIQQKINEFMGY
jgi:hypothetical protein